MDQFAVLSAYKADEAGAAAAADEELSGPGPTIGAGGGGSSMGFAAPDDLGRGRSVDDGERGDRAATQHSWLGSIRSVIAAAHQRAAAHLGKPKRLGHLPQLIEFLGSPIALHG